jgi:hypothetical protein
MALVIVLSDDDADDNDRQYTELSETKVTTRTGISDVFILLFFFEVVDNVFYSFIIDHRRHPLSISFMFLLPYHFSFKVMLAPRLPMKTLCLWSIPHQQAFGTSSQRLVSYNVRCRVAPQRHMS